MYWITDNMINIRIICHLLKKLSWQDCLLNALLLYLWSIYLPLFHYNQTLICFCWIINTFLDTLLPRLFGKHISIIISCTFKKSKRRLKINCIGVVLRFVITMTAWVQTSNNDCWNNENLNNIHNWICRIFVIAMISSP